MNENENWSTVDPPETLSGPSAVSLWPLPGLLPDGCGPSLLPQPSAGGRQTGNVSSIAVASCSLVQFFIRISRFNVFFLFFFLLDRTNRIDWLTIRPESESEKEALNQIMQMANSSRNSFCSKESKIGRSQRMSNDPSSWCVSVRHLGAGRNGG